MIGVAQGSSDALSKLCVVCPLNEIAVLNSTSLTHHSKEAIQRGPQHAQVKGVRFEEEGNIDQLEFEGFDVQR